MTAVAGIGSAPVSYGVFGGADTSRLAVRPTELLEAMVVAGYSGSELGPPGFFGTPEQTAAAFADHGLAVVGAYVPLHLSQTDEVMAADLEAMRRTLEELAACRAPGALAILADEGDDELTRHPFRPIGDRGSGMSPQQWDVAANRITSAAEVARSFGIETSFHPHFGTYVEQSWEIDELMERTDVPLCLDTGHVHVGGSDPVALLRRWRDRINHVHVKDLRESVLINARERGDEDLEAWWEDLCIPLGQGDVWLEAFLAELTAADYTGWLIVEQDRGPATAEAWQRIAADQRANHDWLTTRVRDGGL